MPMIRVGSSTRSHTSKMWKSPKVTTTWRNTVLSIVISGAAAISPTIVASVVPYTVACARAQQPTHDAVGANPQFIGVCEARTRDRDEVAQARNPEDAVGTADQVGLDYRHLLIVEHEIAGAHALDGDGRNRSATGHTVQDNGRSLCKVEPESLRDIRRDGRAVRTGIDQHPEGTQTVDGDGHQDAPDAVERGGRGESRLRTSDRNGPGGGRNERRDPRPHERQCQSCLALLGASMSVALLSGNAARRAICVALPNRASNFFTV